MLEQSEAEKHVEVEKMRVEDGELKNSKRELQDALKCSLILHCLISYLLN